MEATQQFRDAVREDPLRLDRTLLLVAGHDHEVDVDAVLLEIDGLAAGVGERSVEGVVDHLCAGLGFVGNTDDYDAADNSYLDRVVRGRTGLPILLSVVTIEVGRRLGVRVDGVGMPGHFIVGDPSRSDRYFDLFAGGVEVDGTECRARHAAAHPQIPWSPAFLQPVEPMQIVVLVLNNLMASHRRRQHRRSAALVASLATALPGAGPRELLTYVGALAEAGRYDRAARTADVVARRLDPKSQAKVVAAAQRYRARLN
jgi:regulator of sirC expression with transglutaminase-like and TPR domain